MNEETENKKDDFSLDKPPKKHQPVYVKTGNNTTYGVVASDTVFKENNLNMVSLRVLHMETNGIAMIHQELLEGLHYIKIPLCQLHKMNVM